MPFYLALDAGGTKTDYALADETSILARVRTGTIKRMRTDADAACLNLETALGELTRLSGVSMSAITRCCIGTAGQTVPLVRDWLRTEVPARVAGDLIIVGDVEIALDAAFPGQAGVLVLAGTGSNVAGRTPHGIMSNTGGWGPALADNGSGHRIGHEALRSVFLAIDEGRETDLLREFMAFWKLDSLDDLVAFANTIPAPDFSRLTPIVARCAEEGDEVAIQSLHKEGADLGYLVRLLMRRLRKLSGDQHFTPSLAFAGSIMENIMPVRNALISDVRAEFPDAIALEGVVDPINGALWRARTGGRQ